MGFLCEQARHKVLASSIQGAKVNELVEKLIQAMWLADIEIKRGKPSLRDVIRQLPDAYLLRVALCTHLMFRVYWSQSQKKDRLELLDAAEQLIRSLHLQFDKSRMQRQIERFDPNEEVGS
jgi:hypothetical protein